MGQYSAKISEGHVKLPNTLIVGAYQHALLPAEAGMIQWTGSDFEGYDGSSWQSLTGKGSMSSWTARGDGDTTKSIQDQDIFDIAGGTDISTSLSGTGPYTMTIDFTGDTGGVSSAGSVQSSDVAIFHDASTIYAHSGTFQYDENAIELKVSSMRLGSDVVGTSDSSDTKFQTNGTIRGRFDTSGNFGVQATNPDGIIDVAGASNATNFGFLPSGEDAPSDANFDPYQFTIYMSGGAGEVRLKAQGASGNFTDTSIGGSSSSSVDATDGENDEIAIFVDSNTIEGKKYLKMSQASTPYNMKIGAQSGVEAEAAELTITGPTNSQPLTIQSTADLATDTTSNVELSLQSKWDNSGSLNTREMDLRQNIRNTSGDARFEIRSIEGGTAKEYFGITINDGGNHGGIYFHDDANNSLVQVWDAANADILSSVLDNNSITVNTLGALTGGANVSLGGSINLDHATSSASSIDGSGAEAIQDVTIDAYGHVTGLTKTNFDSRYVNEAGDSMTGDLDLQGNSLTTRNIYGHTTATDVYFHDSIQMNGGGQDLYIHNLTDPQSAQDAATKGYVDANASFSDWRIEADDGTLKTINSGDKVTFASNANVDTELTGTGPYTMTLNVPNGELNMSDSAIKNCDHVRGTTTYTTLKGTVNVDVFADTNSDGSGDVLMSIGSGASGDVKLTNDGSGNAYQFDIAVETIIHMDGSAPNDGDLATGQGILYRDDSTPEVRMKWKESDGTVNDATVADATI